MGNVARKLKDHKIWKFSMTYVLFYDKIGEITFCALFCSCFTKKPFLKMENDFMYGKVEISI
jgi:hypothetical protein